MAQAFSLIPGEFDNRQLPQYSLSSHSDHHHEFEASVSRSDLYLRESQINGDTVHARIAPSKISKSIERIERRRKRERESARRCRARKQNRIQQLQEQTLALEQLNQFLRKQLIDLNKKPNSIKTGSELICKIQNALDEYEESEGDKLVLQALLQQFYSITGRISREQTLDLKIFKGCSGLNSSVFLAYILASRIETTGTKTRTDVLRNELDQEIRLAPQQSNELFRLTTGFHEKMKLIFDTSRIQGDAIAMLEQYFRITRNVEDLAKEIVDIAFKSILTQTQQAKLIVWLERKQESYL